MGRRFRHPQGSDKMETINVSSFGSDFHKDSAMYNAIASNTPVWPQWERLSDMLALISLGE